MKETPLQRELVLHFPNHGANRHFIRTMKDRVHIESIIGLEKVLY
jgi:hypothetical protein